MSELAPWGACGQLCLSSGPSVMGAVWVGRVGTGRGLDCLDSVQAFVLSTARGWRLSQEVGRRKEARRGAAHEGSCRLRYGGESLSWEGGALPKGLPLGGAVIGSAIAPSAPASPSRASSPPPAPASSSPSVTSPSGSSRAAGAAPRQAPCQPPPYASPVRTLSRQMPLLFPVYRCECSLGKDEPDSPGHRENKRV